MGNKNRASELANAGPDVVRAVRKASELIAKAGPDYDRLWNELRDVISRAGLPQERQLEIFDLMKLIEMVRLAHLMADRLINDAASLAIGEAPELMLGVKRKKGGKAGGKVKKKTAAEWQSKCIADAKKLLESGRERRELAGILAPIHKKSARQIRDVLKKAEVG